MWDLYDIAERMEAGEKFIVKFNFRSKKDPNKIETKMSKLLDVVESRNRIFVNDGKSIIWIELSEVLDIYPEQ